MIKRFDFAAIANWVKPNARVLDLGCGDGSLLRYLREARGAFGYGIDNDDKKILAAVRNGVNVLQGNLEGGLAGFESDSFDHVILSQTLQAVRHTEDILTEMLRVGHEAIITFPNFGFWRHRLALLGGRMPVSTTLPHQWYDTPNVHLFTVTDFETYCRDRGIRMLERLFMNEGETVSFMPNVLSSLAAFRLARP